MSHDKTVYHSAIWYEQAEANNPFTAKTYCCHGYDVYQQIIPNATWIESLFLLFMGERPCRQQIELLEKVSLILSYPSMREASMRAAMNSGVSGATNAASLIAALAIGAGQYGGAREVFLLVQLWHKHGLNNDVFLQALLAYRQPVDPVQADIWHHIEHPLGFDVHSPTCASTIQQALELLVAIKGDGALSLLKQHQRDLEGQLNASLALTGVVSAALYDIGFKADQAEMLFLILRLPAAAVFSLEQKQQGWQKFPFFGHQIQLDEGI